MKKHGEYRFKMLLPLQGAADTEFTFCIQRPTAMPSARESLAPHQPSLRA